MGDQIPDDEQAFDLFLERHSELSSDDATVSPRVFRKLVDNYYIPTFDTRKNLVRQLNEKWGVYEKTDTSEADQINRDQLYTSNHELVETRAACDNLLKRIMEVVHKARFRVDWGKHTNKKTVSDNMEWLKEKDAYLSAAIGDNTSNSIKRDVVSVQKSMVKAMQAVVESGLQTPRETPAPQRDSPTRQNERPATANDGDIIAGTWWGENRSRLISSQGFGQVIQESKAYVKSNEQLVGTIEYNRTINRYLRRAFDQLNMHGRHHDVLQRPGWVFRDEPLSHNQTPTFVNPSRSEYDWRRGDQILNDGRIGTPHVGFNDIKTRLGGGLSARERQEMDLPSGAVYMGIPMKPLNASDTAGSTRLRGGMENAGSAQPSASQAARRAARVELGARIPWRDPDVLYAQLLEDSILPTGTFRQRVAERRPPMQDPRRLGPGPRRIYQEAIGSVIDEAEWRRLQDFEEHHEIRELEALYATYGDDLRADLTRANDFIHNNPEHFFPDRPRLDEVDGRTARKLRYDGTRDRGFADPVAWLFRARERAVFRLSIAWRLYLDGHSELVDLLKDESAHLATCISHEEMYMEWENNRFFELSNAEEIRHLESRYKARRDVLCATWQRQVTEIENWLQEQGVARPRHRREGGGRPLTPPSDNDDSPKPPRRPKPPKPLTSEDNRESSKRTPRKEKSGGKEKKKKTREKDVQTKDVQTKGKDVQSKDAQTKDRSLRTHSLQKQSTEKPEAELSKRQETSDLASLDSFVKMLFQDAEMTNAFDADGALTDTNQFKKLLRRAAQKEGSATGHFAAVLLRVLQNKSSDAATIVGNVLTSLNQSSEESLAVVGKLIAFLHLAAVQRSHTGQEESDRNAATEQYMRQNGGTSKSRKGKERESLFWEVTQGQAGSGGAPRLSDPARPAPTELEDLHKKIDFLLMHSMQNQPEPSTKKSKSDLEEGSDEEMEDIDSVQHEQVEDEPRSLEYLRTMREAYDKALNAVINENNELDVEDPGNQAKLERNNIDIMAKNQVLWSLDTEITNLQRSLDPLAENVVGLGADRRWELPTKEAFSKYTTAIPKQSVLPLGVTSLGPGPIPGQKPIPGSPRILVGAPPKFGQDARDDDSHHKKDATPTDQMTAYAHVQAADKDKAGRKRPTHFENLPKHWDDFLEYFFASWKSTTRVDAARLRYEDWIEVVSMALTETLQQYMTSEHIAPGSILALDHDTMRQHVAEIYGKVFGEGDVDVIKHNTMPWREREMYRHKILKTLYDEVWDAADDEESRVRLNDPGMLGPAPKSGHSEVESAQLSPESLAAQVTLDKLRTLYQEHLERDGQCRALVRAKSEYRSKWTAKDQQALTELSNDRIEKWGVYVNVKNQADPAIRRQARIMEENLKEAARLKEKSNIQQHEQVMQKARARNEEQIRKSAAQDKMRRTKLALANAQQALDTKERARERAETLAGQLGLAAAMKQQYDHDLVVALEEEKQAKSEVDQAKFDFNAAQHGLSRPENAPTDRNNKGEDEIQPTVRHGHRPDHRQHDHHDQTMTREDRTTTRGSHRTTSEEQKKRKTYEPEETQMPYRSTVDEVLNDIQGRIYKNKEISSKKAKIDKGSPSRAFDAQAEQAAAREMQRAQAGALNRKTNDDFYAATRRTINTEREGTEADKATAAAQKRSDDIAAAMARGQADADADRRRREVARRRQTTANADQRRQVIAAAAEKRKAEAANRGIAETAKRKKRNSSRTLQGTQTRTPIETPSEDEVDVKMGGTAEADAQARKAQEQEDERTARLLADNYAAQDLNAGLKAQEQEDERAARLLSDKYAAQDRNAELKAQEQEDERAARLLADRYAAQDLNAELNQTRQQYSPSASSDESDNRQELRDRLTLLKDDFEAWEASMGLKEVDRDVCLAVWRGDVARLLFEAYDSIDHSLVNPDAFERGLEKYWDELGRTRYDGVKPSEAERRLEFLSGNLETFNERAVEQGFKGFFKKRKSAAKDLVQRSKDFLNQKRPLRAKGKKDRNPEDGRSDRSYSPPTVDSESDNQVEGGVIAGIPDSDAWPDLKDLIQVTWISRMAYQVMRQHTSSALAPGGRGHGWPAPINKGTFYEL
ncbi:hypothetical protein F5Y18DRAFT_426359 [Xylariaceae sp. FL1019]|nr:hypothetical protein F5Y18DRAFT_426359 [Xylariaceae sp. FL1019]